MKVDCQTHSSLTSNKKVYFKIGRYWLAGAHWRPNEKKGVFGGEGISSEMSSIKVCRRAKSSSDIYVSPHCRGKQEFWTQNLEDPKWIWPWKPLHWRLTFTVPEVLCKLTKEVSKQWSFLAFNPGNHNNDQLCKIYI